MAAELTPAEALAKALWDRGQKQRSRQMPTLYMNHPDAADSHADAILSALREYGYVLVNELALARAANTSSGHDADGLDVREEWWASPNEMSADLMRYLLEQQS